MPRSWPRRWRRHGGLKGSRCCCPRLQRKRRRWEVGRSHHRLGMRVRRYDQRRIRRLIRAWRRLHVWVRRIPVRIVLGRVRWRNMAVEVRRMVSHVCGRGAQVGRRCRVGNVMLPSRRRHGRLPMGHCGQMMVHHGQAPFALTVQPRLASMGAMRDINRVNQGRATLHWPIKPF